jgi:hypothetical protein
MAYADLRGHPPQLHTPSPPKTLHFSLGSSRLPGQPPGDAVGRAHRRMPGPGELPLPQRGDGPGPGAARGSA